MSLQSDIDARLTPERGDDVLDDALAFIERFCAFPDDHCATAVTLWAAHTHMIEHLYATPRLALLSPEPQSGKTRVLEVLDLLVLEPQFTVTASTPSIFRQLLDGYISLLYDEVDTVWSYKGKDNNNEDLRALFNAGYKRGAKIPRCVGPNHDVVNFPVFCPVALAGLGILPDTIMSRSIIIRMRPRAPNERVEKYQPRLHDPIGHALRDRLAQWSEQLGQKIGSDYPNMPDGIADRAEEIWEPLIAIADAAGGQWPELARIACVELCKVAQDRQASLGVRLLADLRTIFGEATTLHTRTILDRLTDGETYGLEPDAPWGSLRGEALVSRGLARLLKPYGVKSTKVKVAGRSLQGYRREDLWDAWERYLPVVPAKAEPVEPPAPAEPCGEEEVPAIPFQRGPMEPEKAPGQGWVPEVPDVPAPRDPTSACVACGGEGCGWCREAH